MINGKSTWKLHKRIINHDYIADNLAEKVLDKIERSRLNNSKITTLDITILKNFESQMEFLKRVMRIVSHILSIDKHVVSKVY